LLSFAASGGLCTGVLRGGRLNARAGIDTPRTLGAPGLILSRGNIDMVLLDEPANAGGPRVVAIPGQPLLYQSVPLGSGSPLPPALFKAPKPYFLQSILLDFSLSGTRYEKLHEQGFFYFAAYLGALTLLLCSLGFVLKISAWPLANLFLGALVFRGILLLETFINSEEVLEILNEYIENIVPRPLISALILGLAAALIILYSLLAGLAKKRPADG
jgi:hypothetical protein